MMQPFRMMCVLKANIILQLNFYTMKSFRLLFAFALILLGAANYAQNVTLQVSGIVTDQQTALPVANHMVAVTVYPDSINNFETFTDSTFTDQSGAYSLPIVIEFVPGTATFFSAGTFDCTMSWLQQTFVYSGTQTSFTADFAICTDTIPPPSPCENYITPIGIQGLTVTLQGGITNGQTASYFWDFGDNNSDTGQYITHTYAQQGVYNVVLQTITPYGCIDFSNYTLVLMDSINPPSGCENYISLNGVQGLTVELHGDLYIGEASSYFWTLGDGSSATGMDVTHTYAQQGMYEVQLQTITSDSCMDQSSFTVVLMDSINNGCEGYFIAAPTGNQFEIAFEGFTQSNYPTEFTWELGDGTTATGQNLVHTYCCPGTFMIVLTTSDSTGCSSTFAAPVVVSSDSVGNMTLGGQVIAGNSYLNVGIVTLFGTDPAGSYYPVQSTYIDSAGYYNFWNVGAGTYIILAYPQPDSLGTGIQYLPTYYGDVIFWEQATPIYLGVPLNPYNINLVSFDSIGGGDGTIYGQLIGGGKSMLSGGQEVLLLDAFGTPVRITYTDPQGYFSFASLPFGEYKVNPVITGLTTQPAIVDLDATTPSADVTMTINGNTITGIIERGKAGMIESIYPNPAFDQISVALKTQGKVEIQILDASGRVVWVKNETISASGSLLTIPVSDFTPGLYFLFIQDDIGNTSSRRFVKN
jgi:PKD repeat protein